MKNKYKRLYKYLLIIVAILTLSVNNSFAADEYSIPALSDDSKISKIEFQGNHLINEADIIKVMNLQVGDVYNKDNVQQNLKAIYKTGYFSEKMKAIPIPTSPDSVTLRIYLEENIPITGFAHSVTSSALDYKKDGLITGLGANVFKLAGSVILYGIVSAFILAVIKVVLYG